MRIARFSREKKKAPKLNFWQRRRKVQSISDQSTDCSTSDTSSEKTFSPHLVRVSSLVSGSAHDDTPISFDSDDENEDFYYQKSMGDSSKNSNGSATIVFSKPDVYGQEHPAETPEVIAAKLVAFDKEVAKTPNHKKKGLNQAMVKCPHLLDDQFKLMFLRCEVFCEKRAAKRYAKYWDLRLQIFGPEKAFQPLTQETALNEDDLYALSTGAVTVVKGRDFAGRHICYGNPARQQIGKYPTISMVRAIWYVFHKALEDETSQKKGIVFMGDLRTTGLAHFDPELVRLLAISAQGGLPMRISAIHGCSPPRIFNVIFPLIKALMGERLRKRIRLHGMPIEEVRKELAKYYGLPLSELPEEIGGHVVVDHDEWTQEWRRTEHARLERLGYLTTS